MGTYMNNMLESDRLTVAQLAVSYAGALAIFNKYNIDYCCGGNQSIDEVCFRAGLDPEKIKQEIFQSSGIEVSQNLHPERWSSAFLVDFIIQNHHSYVRKSIPEIQHLLDKVCDVHGKDRLELLVIRERFVDLAGELTQHMEKEELILFPSIKRVEALNDDALATSTQQSLLSAELEHVIAGDLIKEIRSLSKNYTPPEFACPTFKITWQKLQEFDNDLMRHIHLENNILFERLKTEKKSSYSI